MGPTARAFPCGGPTDRVTQVAQRGVLTTVFVSAAVVSAVAIGGCVDQPKPHCVATTNPFAVKLIELERAESVAGACTTFGPASFNADPEIGLSPYYARGRDGQPDFDRGSLAVQTAELGSLFYTAEGFDIPNAAPDGQIYSFGDFTGADPDADNICTVTELSPTHLVLPAIAAVPDDPATEDADESFPGQAPVDATLNWANVRVYVTADIFGTQMDGEFTDTRLTDNGDSCSITYRAVGLAPAVPCGLSDADGNPLMNADGTFQTNVAACEPEPNPAEGRPASSGISPSTRFECDPITAYCVLQSDSIPSIR